jgi:hypothetical protein
MEKIKKTLVIGASPNPERYSYLATSMLHAMGYDVVAYGRRKGTIHDIEITQEFPINEKFHTVTLYLNPKNQEEYYDKIISLKPKRVVFNPGTENEDFYSSLQDANIAYEEACTLVLLRTGAY